MFDEFEDIVLQRVISFEDRMIDDPEGTREVSRIMRPDTATWFQDAGVNPMPFGENSRLPFDSDWNVNPARIAAVIDYIYPPCPDDEDAFRQIRVAQL